MTKTLRAGVMGWPVSHSKSPILHGHWLKTHQIDGTYEHVEVDTNDFAAKVRDLVAKGWRGVNVTLPHKEAALAIADEVSDTARAIGAANTLVFSPDGVVHAENTDGFGFIENLRQGAGNAWQPNRPAFVLGAGGASRAIIYGLLQEGVPEIRLTNRTAERAAALAAEFGPKITLIPWETASEALSGAALLVNTTSLGMKGAPPLKLDISRADADAVATDIVYTPLVTAFLEKAAARGLKTVDGLGMLLHQARPGFQAWFGATPKVDDRLRNLILNA